MPLACTLVFDIDGYQMALWAVIPDQEEWGLGQEVGQWRVGTAALLARPRGHPSGTPRSSRLNHRLLIASDQAAGAWSVTIWLR